jgi:DNA ligase-1
MRSHFVPAPSRPPCRYGATCYQLSAAHWRGFDHPDTHPRLETTANKKQKLDHDLGGDTEEDEPTPTPLAVPAPPPPQPAAALPASLPVVPAVVIAAALPAPSSAAPSGADPLGPLADMESRSVQGSGANVYELKRVGETYSCSCPSWRNQKGAGSMRTCKHLKALRGEQAELERLGGDPKAFFASGNRVAGQAAAAGAGVAPTNEAVVKTVALADSWDGVRDLTGWALSEKLDGMRCLWDGKGGCFSRAGKEVYVPASLCLQLPLGTALDGELWLGRGQFQRAMSIVRRTDRSESAWAPIEYVVYDAPEAPGGIFDRLAAARAALAAVPAATPIAPSDAASAATSSAAASTAIPRVSVRVLEHEAVQCMSHILRRHEEVAAGGGEGLMARHPHAAHRPGRTPDLLKIKRTVDDEALVIGHEAGKGKHTGRLGALKLKLRNGNTFHCGTGFTDAERESPPPIGTVVTFQYFELTDGGIPRFPRFRRVRPDVDAAEFTG